MNHRQRRVAGLTLACATFALTAGCVEQHVGRVAVRLAPDLTQAVLDEPDFELARTAAMSNVEILEGLARHDPRNSELHMLLARALGGVALVFLEDDLERLELEADSGASAARVRQRRLYERARIHALRSLELRHPGLGSAVVRGGPQLAARLSSATGPSDVPALFWYSFNSVSALWAGERTVGTVAELASPLIVLRHVAHLDERYFFGAPLLLLAITNASVPPVFGGSPDAAREEFERSLEISEGRLLLARVQFARVYALQQGDRALFEEQLTEALQAPLDILPDHRLLTLAAKRSAERLLAHADRLFPSGSRQGAIPDAKP